MKRLLAALALCLTLTTPAFAANRASLLTTAQNTPFTQSTLGTFFATLLNSIPTLSDNNTLTGLFLNGTAEPAITLCGGTPVIFNNSTNGSGAFETGSGAPTACTITFATPYPTADLCSVTAGNAAAAAITGGYWISGGSPNGLVLALGTGTSSAIFNYVCSGN